IFIYLLPVVSSAACFFNVPQTCYYNATKSALTSFTQDLHYLASFDNIKVSVVVPGVIATNMTQNTRQPLPNKDIILSSPKGLVKIIKNQLNSDTFCIGWPFYQYLFSWAFSTFPVRTKLTFSRLLGNDFTRAIGNDVLC